MKLYFNRSLIVIWCVALISYIPILQGFFAQDEWFVFAQYFVYQKSPLFRIIFSFFTPNLAHYVPLTHATTYLAFIFFELNYDSYAILSIGLHLIISGLVYILINKIADNRKIAFITGILFAINPAGHQAVSWVVANINSQGSSILGIVSLITFFVFLKECKYRYFIISILSLVASLFFKETTIGMFLLLPTAYLLFSSSKKYKKDILALPILIGFIYGLIRILFMFLSSADASVASQTQTMGEILYNALTFPFKGTVQSIIPPPVMLDIAYGVGNVISGIFMIEPGTTAFDIFVQQTLLEWSNLIIFVLFILVIFLLNKYKRINQRVFKILFFALVFSGVSSVIFALSPERYGKINLLDSRNLYLVTLGSSLFISTLLVELIKSKVLLVLSVVSIGLLSFFSLQTQLNALTADAKNRENILRQIKSEYPDLPQRTIFYFESDKSYYGLPDSEKILPFQSGFGQTLMVWYQVSEDFPQEILVDDFLWPIDSQGYKEINNVGFGYFRDKNLLLQTMKDHQLNPDSVIAFSWNSQTNYLYDITGEIRAEIKDLYEKN